MKMLGFDASQATNLVIGMLSSAGSVKSLNQAQLNSLQNILIKCDAVTGSYMNTQESNVVACVTPNVSSYSTIFYSPYHPLRLPVNKHRIDQMTISLVDQDGNEVDLGTDNGTLTPELWSVVLDIEPIEMARIL